MLYAAALRVETMMAFMFETRHVIRPTRRAFETPTMQLDYDGVWSRVASAKLP